MRSLSVKAKSWADALQDSDKRSLFSKTMVWGGYEAQRQPTQKSHDRWMTYKMVGSRMIKIPSFLYKASSSARKFGVDVHKAWRGAERFDDFTSTLVRFSTSEILYSVYASRDRFQSLQLGTIGLISPSEGQVTQERVQIQSFYHQQLVISRVTYPPVQAIRTEPTYEYGSER